ncbi:hypothetical protein F4680DRAFT_254677 [Xylaria scruposa]|nr:hypothetical protein F4680DRAFT_254677 [Xylaria scruposa]
MSPTDVLQSSASTFSAKDLLNLDEERLIQFMEHNFRPGSGFYIEDVSGLELLSNGQRAELGEKLRAAGKKVAGAPAPYVLDFGEVVTKLNVILRAGDGRSQPVPPRSPTESPPPFITDEEYEADCHDELIEEGGRPAIPISLLSEIFKNIGAYDERVRPWLKDPGASGREKWAIFSKQLEDWRVFNKWQWDNRGDPDDLGFSQFFEVTKRRHARDGAFQWISSPKFEETLRRVWERKPKFVETPGDVGFPAYVEAVKRRLAYHNFTEPFHLNEDPRRQDKRTTWIEYLNFEYWWLQKHNASVEALESRYDKALMCFRQSYSALESSTMQDGLHASKSARVMAAEQGTIALQKDLDAVKQTVEEFFRSTKSYHRAKEIALRKRLWLQQVREELRSIESELPPTITKSTEKRQRTEDNITPERELKKRKQNSSLMEEPNNSGSNSIETSCRDGKSTSQTSGDEAQCNKAEEH